jgi:putative addiction module component
MTIEDLEAEALKLSLEARARLAERLLESLENLSDEENARLWNVEAERRNAAWTVSDSARSSDEVFRNARKRPL